jgi:mRNA interferase RelE/StbE
MPPPYRIEWLSEAKADVRALDRPTAMRLFDGILRFARTGSGDVKALRGDMAGALRLRLGDYRVLFALEDNTLRISGVRHRSEAYK